MGTQGETADMSEQMINFILDELIETLYNIVKRIIGGQVMVSGEKVIVILVKKTVSRKKWKKKTMNSNLH